MKKIFISMLMLFSTVISFSQSLDEINEMMGKKDFKNAKAGIDKYLSDAKNSAKADGWYYKGRIYNSFSKEKSTPETDIYDLKNMAYESFKKYQQLDEKDVYMKMELWGSYLDLYFGFYDLGANFFNNKNYLGAYNAFKKGLEVEDFILSKKYIYTEATLHPLDTALVLNTAIAATQAKKDDEAIPYYRKLTDANIAGEGYLDVYEYLVEYYNKKGDDASLNQMLAMARKNYPTNNYWNEIEISKISKSGDQAALYAKYDEIIAKEPGNFTMAYNYSVVLYNKIYENDSKQTDNASKDKLSSVLKIAIASDTGIDATVLMAGHLYKIVTDYYNSMTMIKGPKPEDLKKKSDLKVLLNAKMDECIIYSEKAIKYFELKTDRKPMQTANYKIILSNLSDIYSMKGDAKKSAEYDKKREAIK